MPGLPKDIYEIAEIEKCLHDKTQNANENFNGTIWELFQKILLLHYLI